MKPVLLFIIFVFALSLSLGAQIAEEKQSSYLLNTWYESPKESLGDTLVFRTTKYIRVDGVDSYAYEYASLTFKNNTDFEVAYWRWCPNGNYSPSGNWGYAPEAVILLDFGSDKCKCEMRIISVDKNVLKATLREATTKLIQR